MVITDIGLNYRGKGGHIAARRALVPEEARQNGGDRSTDGQDSVLPKTPASFPHPHE
jgi:hypothetical protein